MQTIDESRLDTDPQYRYDYLAGFLGFGPEEAFLIQSAAPYLGPLIPQLVDQTYEKLLGYTATARHFLSRQAGYDGPLPTDMSELTSAHPQIQFRKEHLSRYFMQILGRSFDAKMVLYLDMVGRIHTPAAGNKEISVPLVQMNALLGLMNDVITGAIDQSPLDAAAKWKTARAFTKLFWIQNDFISRHYAKRSDC